MSAQAWTWLPDGALASPDVLARIDRAVADWGERWFRDHRLVRQRLQYATAPSSPPEVAATPRLAVRATPTAVEALVGHALDADLSRLEKSDDDQTVLAALADDLLRDLAAGLDLALGADADGLADAGSTAGGVLIDLSDADGRKVATIETSRAVLAAARLAGLPESRRRSTPLTPMRSAIATASVVLSARLGSATISLPEARRLAAGDIIVLDRPLDQPIDLVPAAGGPAVACARLEDTASPHSLRLEAAAGRDRR